MISARSDAEAARVVVKFTTKQPNGAFIIEFIRFQGRNYNQAAKAARRIANCILNPLNGPTPNGGEWWISG